MIQMESQNRRKDMVSGNFKVVLDACVLVPSSLCDLLLRLAEHPRLYSPRWTGKILDETRRAQVGRAGFSEELADYWRLEVTGSFPEAMVRDYERFLVDCTNADKDRHVLAAAIRYEADLIVTANLRDFPSASLARWSIEASSPDKFLTGLNGVSPQVVVAKVDDICHSRGRTRERVLGKLHGFAPGFVQIVSQDLGIEPDVVR